MAIFTSFRRGGFGPEEASGGELPEDVRRSLPARFEAVGEALASNSDARPACAVVGRDVARDGAALGEALHGLRTTFRVVVGGEPDFASVEALSVAWSEATLEFIHDLSCEDPLTGMASLAHLRTRLAELYREADQTGEPVPGTHAMVVVDLLPGGTGGDGEQQFARALQLVHAAEMIRAVFFGGETLARLSPSRAAVVVRRRATLGVAVGLLRELLGDLDPGGPHPRVWIEGLPSASASAPRLLDELTR